MIEVVPNPPRYMNKAVTIAGGVVTGIFLLLTILGSVIAPIVMGVVFFLVVTPIGLILKLVGKDPLNLKKNKLKTYWIVKAEPKSKMKNQF